MAKLREIIGEELFKQLPDDKQKEYESKDYEDVSGGAYIPKARFDQVNQEAKTYKGQVDEREKQIIKIKEEYKDVDGLKEKLEKLELENKTQKETHEGELAKIAFDNALEKGLNAFNVKDKTLIMAKLNKENLKVDGENIIGLKEQIEPLQKSHEYLFEKVVKGTSSFNSGGIEQNKEPQEEHIATRLAKQHAEAAKSKGILDFAK